MNSYFLIVCKTAGIGTLALMRDNSWWFQFSLATLLFLENGLISCFLCLLIAFFL